MAHVGIPDSTPADPGSKVYELTIAVRCPENMTAEAWTQVQNLCAVFAENLRKWVPKHMEYGPMNVALLGERGLALRVLEKALRLDHMAVKGRTPTTESIEDSWLDIANLALMAQVVRKGWWPGVLPGREIGQPKQE